VVLSPTSLIISKDPIVVTTSNASYMKGLMSSVQIRIRGCPCVSLMPQPLFMLFLFTDDMADWKNDSINCINFESSLSLFFH
jgi:hypothetical protein